MERHSAIYEGWVRHRRARPAANAFRYALFMMYLDLDELPELFDGSWIWGYERPAIAGFHRVDHLGDPRRPLREAVIDAVEDELGRRPDGPIRLLTHLRYFGYAFNPVSVYYCFDGSELDAVVLDVRNTPWGQRHVYVLDAAATPSRGPVRATRRKAFHVSPFLPMAMTYRFALTRPSESLAIHIACDADPSADDAAPTEPVLDATLSLRRRRWSPSALNRILLRYPWMTGKTIAAIYWQAFRLWRRRVPYIPPPRQMSDDEDLYDETSIHDSPHRPAPARRLDRPLGEANAARSPRRHS